MERDSGAAGFGAADRTPASDPVQAALHKAGERYFRDCRDRVDDFIRQHFRYPGAWQTNRVALGWDLLRAPLNLFWVPFYVLAMLLAGLAERCGWAALDRNLRRVPTGLPTEVQRQVADLVYRDLLRWGENGDLEQYMVEALADLSEPTPETAAATSQLRAVVDESLGQYGLTRTAAADITNSLATTVLGAFAFNKFTPGGIAAGLVLASWFAERQARANFFLGEFLGGLYYSIFPVEPTLGAQAAGVAIALAILAAFASFSGLVTDPLQSIIGLHRYRLNRLVDSLERDYQNATRSSFSPKSPYLARVLELLDAAKLHLV